MMVEGTQIKPLSAPVWWLLFLGATYGMSLWFDASRAFFAAPEPARLLPWLGATVLLVLVMAVLMYDSYVKERTRGKVHRPVRLFEWAYRRQYGDRSGGSTTP